MTGKYADRIDKGIALLDENVRGWRDKINLRTLDLGSAKQCILGQACADLATEAGFPTGFEYGYRALLENSPWELGFDIANEDTYAGLKAAWIRKIGEIR